ncbi:hypothetical protein MAUB_00780 [Mycolicibacterium aubagnense]|uniref:HTH cro/C1-type domain-containing protein n=2 Tax=Mycolicibacterium aubagnense TaxID=319707 RepID=A0ABM7I6N2_9MYCO|nr:hypothetical protein C1S80_29430 [Mycolicibacterium aubagnense]BBX82205.1 hypothetical protein MAUB_00780 [Mycolicibacterium aubagnense]
MPIHAQRTFDLPDTAVGAALKVARGECCLDLRDAADAAGLDWRVLSRIERGERPCRVTELVALAEAYHLAADVLLLAILGDEEALAHVEELTPPPAEGPAEEARHLTASQRSAIRKATAAAAAEHGRQWTKLNTVTKLAEKYGISSATVEHLHNTDPAK